MLFTTFAGYLAGGIAGAVLATFFVLLPSFVFVIGGPHYVEKVRDNRTIQAFIAGVSAAVLRGTDSKSVAPVLTSFYCALPSSIYRRFSGQSTLRLAWYQHVTPSSSPHVGASRESSYRPIWVPTLDTLRNFFYPLKADMKLTFEPLRQGPLAG